MENGYLQYCEEVLGLRLFPHASASPESDLVPVAVDCEMLSPGTSALLTKIMNSIGIKTWAMGVDAHHVFRFQGQGERDEHAGRVIWNLPRLSEMAGEGPEVATHKKVAWAVLQTAQREIKPQ